MIKLTKINRVTGACKEHEFRVRDKSNTYNETGKCSGVSNVKGNSPDGACKYDVKLTDATGVQVSLGRICGKNSLQIANLMVTTFLRGDYGPSVGLEEVQTWCEKNASGVSSEDVLCGNAQHATENNDTPPPNSAQQANGDNDTPLSDGTQQANGDNGTPLPNHVLSEQLLLQQGQIKKLKRGLRHEIRSSKKLKGALMKFCKTLVEKHY